MRPDCPVPLERLRTPMGLDGRNGVNRASGGMPCRLAADNDLAALQAWLAEFNDSPRTQRHYRKEAERLLLWSLVERGKPLSSLLREDLQCYGDFLADPQPRQRWCGPRAPRLSASWRPFLGPLSDASRRTALLVINALFSYLVQAGYLAGNPLALERRRRHASGHPSVERYLSHEQWHEVLHTVESLPRQTPLEQGHYERCRFLLTLLYLLGPRVGEVAGHTMGSFRRTRGRWWWHVTGKGGKPARVPVNQDMLAALLRYRRFLGLGDYPAPDETTPLIPDLRGRRGIGDNMIYRIVKTLIHHTADRLEPDQPEEARLLRRASTHWLRHTSITHQADAGIELRHLSRNARHARLDTTGLYLHAEEGHWHAAMENHRLPWESDA